MKTIKIDHTDYNVTDETLEKVLKIVLTEKVCQFCKKTYTDDNPEILRNICMNDARQRHGEPLTFSHVKLDKYPTYYFTNVIGNVYYASPAHESSRLSTSTNVTLTFYGFTFPTEINGRAIYRDWSYRGNPAIDSKLIISASYDIFDNNKCKYITKRAEYITFKNNGYIELNRRKKIVQEALKKSEKEATAKKEWFKEAYLYKYLPDNKEAYL